MVGSPGPIGVGFLVRHLVAVARSVARPSCSGSGFNLMPWGTFSDYSNAARLAMSRAPLNFGSGSADVFALHVL